MFEPLVSSCDWGASDKRIYIDFHEVQPFFDNKLLYLQHWTNSQKLRAKKLKQLYLFDHF